MKINLKLSLPSGAKVSEPISVELDSESLDPREFVAWLEQVAESVDIEAADIAALADGKHLSASQQKLIDPLADILAVEGYGGREYSVIPHNLLNVVAERMEWLELQREEQIR